VLHLYGQPRDPAYLERQQQFAAEHPWFRVQQVDAQSHFAMAEAPEQVAAAIEEFLR
jgi:pimeloyl-ACP methyl ester carboxylesterase